MTCDPHICLWYSSQILSRLSGGVSLDVALERCRRMRCCNSHRLFKCTRHRCADARASQDRVSSKCAAEATSEWRVSKIEHCSCIEDLNDDRSWFDFRFRRRHRHRIRRCCRCCRSRCSVDIDKPACQTAKSPHGSLGLFCGVLAEVVAHRM